MFFRSFIVLLLLLGISVAFETTVSLEGASKVYIESDLHFPISLSTDKDVPLGTAVITIGSLNTRVDLNDIRSSLRGEQLEIFISGEGLSQQSSGSSSLSPSLLLIVSGLMIFTRNRSLIVALAIAVMALGVQSVTEEKIEIRFSPLENLNSLSVVSRGSVISSGFLVDICQSGESNSRMSKCHSMVCDISDSDCISSDFFPVGALLPLNDRVFENYLVALEISANRFGRNLPFVQVIVSNSGGTPDSARNAAQSLYDLGCRYFIGPLYSGEALEVLKWSESLEDRVTLLSPSASSTNLAAYSNFFSLFPNNNEFSKAFCNYLSFASDLGQFEHSTFFAVVSQIEYEMNLFSHMAESCSALGVELVEVATYDSMNSLDDAIPIIQTLNTKLSDNPNASVMIFGFAEVVHLLEAAQEVGGLVKTVNWFTSDAAFDDSVIADPAIRQTANDVFLSGFYFIGYKPDEKVELRNDALQSLFQNTGDVDFLSIFVHDAAMMMYLTLEQMGEVFNNQESFRENLLETSESSYGLTGYLGLESDGFREIAEYLIGAVSPRNEYVDLPWKALYFLSYKGNGLTSGSFDEQVHFDRVMYYEFNTSLLQCDSPLSSYGWFRDHLGRLGSYTAEGISGDITFQIPQFSNYTISFLCGDVYSVKTCPGGSRGDWVRCSSVGVSADETLQRTKSIPFGPNPDDVFNGATVIIRESDNMFSSYDGAKGTTLAQLDPHIKPMNLSISFP